MRELPKIISVDDHVVEPAARVADVAAREVARARPAVERKKWGPFKLHPGAKYAMEEDPDGMWGDAWYLDGQLIYVQKRFVAIPLDATPDGDLSKFDPSKMVMTAMTYDEMRPGCYDRDDAREGLRAQLDRRLAAVPDVPALLRPDVHETPDRDLGLACVKAYNDWMVEEWCAPSGGVNIPLCIMPLWDVELAAAGDPAQRRPRRARVLLQRAARPARPAVDPQAATGTRCSRCATTRA